jgi:iron complex transport system substrate-binding protein
MKLKWLLPLVFLFINRCQENALQKPVNPKRIISLAPSITEELFLLGVGDRLLAVTVFCKEPPEVKYIPKIGTILEPNLERIIMLQPDLVIATEDANRRESIRIIKGAGIKVFVHRSSRDFEGICRNFLELSRIFRREKKARTIIEKIKSKINSLQGKINQKGLKKVFLFLQSQPLITASRGTFLDEMITLAGGINIAHGLRPRYPIYSLEGLLRADPDVIIGLKMRKDEDLKWLERFKMLSAVRNKRIYFIDPDEICRPTPVCFLKGLKKLIMLIHHEDNI